MPVLVRSSKNLKIDPGASCSYQLRKGLTMLQITFFMQVCRERKYDVDSNWAVPNAER